MNMISDYIEYSTKGTVIIIEYKEQEEPRRIYPYGVTVSGKTGLPQLLAYQVDGSSGNGYRTFNIIDITKTEVVSNTTSIGLLTEVDALREQFSSTLVRELANA